MASIKRASDEKQAFEKELINRMLDHERGNKMTILRNLGLGMLSLAFLLTAGMAQAAVSGSAHDFSAAGWNSSGEICVVCHTPHDSEITVADAPLWNHAVTAVATYTLYTSATLDATLSQPTGVSKLCLSCHDGTVAVDSFGGATGTTFIGSVGTGSADIGTTLVNDHPVSFNYDAAQALDAGIRDSTTVVAGIGTIADMMFSGSMQCATCHDVHNTDSNASLLRIDNAGSALCLTCHAK